MALTLPRYTREGGSIPITQVFEDVCDACCVLLPIGASDDGAHSQNEKLDRSNYLAGVTTLSNPNFNPDPDPDPSPNPDPDPDPNSSPNRSPSPNPALTQP